jgi:hypothetical protein
LTKVNGWSILHVRGRERARSSRAPAGESSPDRAEQLHRQALRGQERVRFSSPSERKLALIAPAFHCQGWIFGIVGQWAIRALDEMGRVV